MINKFFCIHSYLLKEKILIYLLSITYVREKFSEYICLLNLSERYEKIKRTSKPS